MLDDGVIVERGDFDTLSGMPDGRFTALLAAAGFPRRWPGPFGDAHRNASRHTSFVSIVPDPDHLL